MDSTIISRGGDEMEIEEKKEDVKPEKKAKSYGKARKGIYFGPALDLRAQRPISCCERI